MNYAYTTARVRALENTLPSAEFIQSLADACDMAECINLLNGAGFEGTTADKIIANMKEKKSRLIKELTDDVSEIEVIFYEKNFHNLKAAVKKIYSHSIADLFYNDVTVKGEEIISALERGEAYLLPDYMSGIAEEAYKTLLRTGDGRLSDMMIDKACLEAMSDFADKTKHTILKSYVNEVIAAADIRIALRYSDNDDILNYIVSCGYFSKEFLIKSVKENTLEDFLASVGFGDISLSDADSFFKNRITSLLAKEKYNTFTIAPVINFILEYDRVVSIIRYILICTANGISRERIQHYV